MNTGSFFDNINLQYPEIAVCLEDSDTGVGKFFIPILTPLLSRSLPYDEESTNKNIGNIQNKNKSPFQKIPNYTLSNYIELKIPDGKPVKKDDTFVIVFVGGDLNKIRIIGEY